MIVHAGDFKSETSVRTTSMYMKLGLIPKEMLKKGDDTNMYDVFGNKMYTTYESEMKADTFYILFDINDSDLVMSVCRNFLTVAKEYHEQLYVLESLSGYGTSDSVIYTYYGDKICKSSNCIKDLTLSKIDDMCSAHINREGSHLKLRIR